MGRKKPSSYYDRVVEVMEELVKFVLLIPPGSRMLPQISSSLC